MYSFTAEIESRGYHVYRSKSWNNITVHMPVKVMKETKSLSISTFIIIS